MINKTEENETIEINETAETVNETINLSVNEYVAVNETVEVEDNAANQTETEVETET